MGKKNNKSTTISWAELADYVDSRETKTVINGAGFFMSEARYIGDAKFYAHHQNPPGFLTHGKSMTWTQYSNMMTRAKPSEWDALVRYYESIMERVLKNFKFEVIDTVWPNGTRISDKKPLIQKNVKYQPDSNVAPVFLNVELVPALQHDTMPLWTIDVAVDSARTKDGTMIVPDTKLCIDEYYASQGSFFLGLLKKISESEKPEEVQAWVDRQVELIKEQRAKKIADVKKHVKQLVAKFEKDRNDDTRREVIKTLKMLSNITCDPNIAKIRCERNSTDWVATVKAL